MQDIREESLNESVKSEQSPRVVLWEIDLTVQGGERYFFCNELNEKGEPVTWQGRKYEAYPIDGSGFEMNGRGSSARPSLTVSNLFGLVTGMAEDLQSLVGATDRISDSGACPAVCACGVVRLSGENAGGGAVYPLCEYLCRAGGVFSYCTGRLAAGRDAGGDCGTGPQSSRWAALAERG